MPAADEDTRGHSERRVTHISGLYDPMRHRCAPGRTYSNGNSGSVEEVAVMMISALLTSSFRLALPASSLWESVPTVTRMVGNVVWIRSRRVSSLDPRERLKMVHVWIDGYAVRKSDK